jgi:dihydropteroate synthase
MGVLNVTPDSFSDGGRFLEVDAAVAQGCALLADGATIIDVGGESTRPGSEPVALETELERVLPVIEGLRRRSVEAILSIDTSKAEVARQALALGADIVNDVTALTGDPAMIDVICGSDAGIILMHMQGTPKTMQVAPRYGDPVAEISEFLKKQRDRLLARGVDRLRIAVDPGFGFGKRLQDNIALMRNLPVFAGLGQPLVVGVSRKSTIAALLADPNLPMEERDWPTAALSSLLREKGAHVHRVHQVKPSLQAIRMIEAILHDE